MFLWSYKKNIDTFWLKKAPYQELWIWVRSLENVVISRVNMILVWISSKYQTVKQQTGRRLQVVFTAFYHAMCSISMSHHQDWSITQTILMLSNIPLQLFGNNMSRYKYCPSITTLQLPAFSILAVKFAEYKMCDFLDGFLKTRGPWWSYIAHLTKQICIFTVEVPAKFTALGFLYKLYSTNHPHPPPPHPWPCYFTNLDNLNWILKEGHQRNISAKLYWNWSSGLKSFI